MTKPQNLRLRTNLNGKLDCDCFTVIYPLDTKLFTEGNLLELYIQEEPLGQVEVLMHRELPELKIKDWLAYLATGYDAQRARQLLRATYRKKNETGEIIYSWALLKYARRYNAKEFLLSINQSSKTKGQAQPTLPLSA